MSSGLQESILEEKEKHFINVDHKLSCAHVHHPHSLSSSLYILVHFAVHSLNADVAYMMSYSSEAGGGARIGL